MRQKKLSLAFGVVSVLFVVFVWWVYFNAASSLPVAVPLLASALPLAVAAGFWAFYLWSGHRGAQKLEKAIDEDGESDVRAVSATRGAELEHLRSEFDRAVKALKSSNLARGIGRGGHALYRLPWYAIIGPPASGKTTVLRNSGLKFPYLPGTGDRLKGVGGTRNCDWWLTNHAILLDTAGRWSVEEGERDEWLAFLDLLKRHRSGRPLNGIIAAISIGGDETTSISGASSDELRDIALRMRERLDEITGRLGIVVPVYLLFTKCDLIKGFVESFGNMSSDSRRQVWGFTAPLLQSARRDPGSYFAQQFDVLRDALEKRAEARMSDEVDPRAIPLIYEFPAQLGALKHKLTAFVDELFDASAYRDTPLLRGAYFTSGAQEGAPADLLFHDIASDLKLRPDAVEHRLESKGYFLHDMLMKVVFEDRTLAAASDAELSRRGRRRQALVCALFSTALVGTALSTNACRYNLAALRSTEGALTSSVTAREADAAAEQPVRVAEMLSLEHELGRYERGNELSFGLGLYQGDRVQPGLEHYYEEALLDSVVRPLLRLNHAQVLTRSHQLRAAAGTQYGGKLDDEPRRELRAALALQLLLSSPKESCTPAPLSRRAFVVERLLSLWERADPKASASQDARKRLLERYLELARGRGGSAAFERDGRAVSEARAALGEDDKVERLLSRVIDSHSDPRTLSSLVGDSTSLQASTHVGGAFTRQAWTPVRQIGPGDFLEDDGDWVFGCGASGPDAARAEQDLKTFRARYLERYERSWKALLASTRGREPATVAEAEAMLGELVSRPGVLGKWFASIREHSTLPDTMVAQAEQAARAAVAAAAKKALVSARGEADLGLKLPTGPAPVQPLQRAFGDYVALDQPSAPGAATALDRYRSQLQPVLVALKAFEQDESNVQAVASATQAAIDDTELLLRTEGGRWAPQLRSMLLPVLTGVLQLVGAERSRMLTRAYCDAVYAPFQREFAKRFPFKPESADPASLVAFARFFRPGSGSLWAFSQAHLRTHLSIEGGRYRFTGAQAHDLLSPELPTFLQRASAVTEAFFPDGSDTPRMQYRVRVRGAPGYSLTTLRVGDRALQYDSGDERWIPLSWPGKDDSRGVALAVTPYRGPSPRPLSFENPWGLFMLLQPYAGAQLFERSQRQRTFGWRPRAAQNFIKVDFASDDPRAPLLAAPFVGRSGLFALQPPARISRRGASCLVGGR